MTGVAQMQRWRGCYHLHQTAILVTLILTLVNLTVEGAGASDEGWALLDFKSAVSDDRVLLGAWKAEDTPHRCEWYGISCDKNFHISAINLRNSGLSGTISPELHRLRKLRSLILSESNFSGPIPKQLSKIGGLRKLKLDHNRLLGRLPGQLGFISNLRILDLSHNRLLGRIPETIFRPCHRLRHYLAAQPTAP